MNLREKAYLTTAASLCTTIIAVHMITANVVLGDCKRIEEGKVRASADQVVGVLKRDLESLETSARRLAHGGDVRAASMEYMRDGYGAHVVGLVETGPSSGRSSLDGIAPAHRLPASLTKLVSRQYVSARVPWQRMARKGLADLPEGLFLVAACPVPRSRRSGSPRTAVLGRRIESATLKDVGATVNAPVEIVRYRDRGQPDPEGDVWADLFEGNGQCVQTIGTRFLAGCALLRGIDDSPAAMVRVTVPREVTSAVLASGSSMRMALLFVGLAFGAVLLSVMEKQVLSRLQALRRDLEAVTSSGGTGRRVLSEGADELSAVCAAVNQMLDSLETFEGSIAESEVRFRRVFDEAPVGMIMVDLGGRVMRANPKLREMLLAADGDLPATGFLESTHIDDRPARLALIRQLSSGEVQHGVLEQRLIRSDGTMLWARVTTSLVRNDESQPFYLLEMVEDLTEERRRDEALRTSAVLQERTRLAREMHDTLAQAFTGIIVQLGAASKSLPGNADKALPLVTRARDLAKNGLDEARRSVNALRPSLLERGNLRESIARLVEEARTSTGIEVQFMTDGLVRDLPPDTEDNLLRICQEALTNVQKHARAHHVTVEMVDDGHEVRLSVTDDGRGIDTEETTDGGFGMTSMKERAARIGGRLEVRSAEGEGTQVQVFVRCNGRSKVRRDA